LFIAGILLIAIILLSGCQRESSSAFDQSVSRFETMPPRSLSATFVGVFMLINEMWGDQAATYVRHSAATARNFDIDAVNLIVNWKEIQPTENRFDFKTLQVLIYEIKHAGMYATSESTRTPVRIMRLGHLGLRLTWSIRIVPAIPGMASR